MKRAEVLAAIRAASAEGDERRAIRLYVENRVSRAAYLEAREQGLRARTPAQEERDGMR